MRVAEIAEVINYKISYNIYEVARKMLGDSKANKIKLCSSKGDINKVKGICDWLEENENRKVTGSQHYVLNIFVAENIIQYGEITDEDSINNLFHKILYSSEGENIEEDKLTIEEINHFMDMLRRICDYEDITSEVINSSKKVADFLMESIENFNK